MGYDTRASSRVCVNGRFDDGQIGGHATRGGPDVYGSRDGRWQGIDHATVVDRCLYGQTDIPQASGPTGGPRRVAGGKPPPA